MLALLVVQSRSTFGKLGQEPGTMPMPLAVVDQVVEAEAFLIRTPLNPSSWD